MFKADAVVNVVGGRGLFNALVFLVLRKLKVCEFTGHLVRHILRLRSVHHTSG